MKVLTFAKAAMIALGLFGAMQASAQQRDRGRSQFGEEDPIVLQPDRAYIFFRTPTRATFHFLKEVDEAERAAHVVARAEAFTRARARAERRLEIWQRDRARCRPGSTNYICREPRPVVPTEATFEFAPPEADNLVGNAYRPRLIHQEAWSGWLIAVEPGTYALYGEVVQSTNGPAGACYCLGSVKFDAPAGQITDMGEIVGVPAEQAGVADAQNFRLGHFVTVAPWTAAMRSPAQFASLRVVPAELRASGRMPNLLGVLITRLAPIDGVLGYERDRVIDLRAGRPVTQGAD